MPWLTHEFARAERLDLSFWKHASFFVDKDNHKTHKPFAPQHTPDCGFFCPISVALNYRLLDSACSLPCSVSTPKRSTIPTTKKPANARMAIRFEPVNSIRRAKVRGPKIEANFELIA